MNQMLTAPFSKDEIHRTIRMFPRNKTSDLDIFTTEFLLAFWDVWGDDVCKALNELQESGTLLKTWNATFLALIPKNPGADVFCNFRPISLCNVVYKLLTKILANCLKPLLPLLIPKEQDGFLIGR